MDNNDFVEKLVSLGVSKPVAKNLKTSMNGSDYMNMVDALDLNTGGVNRAEVNKILGKYGIKIRSDEMTENYLNAKFESLKNGTSLDETFGVMTRVSEAFTYDINVSENNRDTVLDWLDENDVSYQATGANTFRVECGDRDVAYRTGRSLSGILGKPAVRDSVETEVNEMDKNTKKRLKVAKDKLDAQKTRNPVAAAAPVGRAGVHNDGKRNPKKDDKFGRGTKHKARYDEEIEENLNEGVLGMKSVSPLYRLRELAGLDTSNMVKDHNSPLAAGTVNEGAGLDGSEWTYEISSKLSNLLRGKTEITMTELGNTFGDLSADMIENIISFIENKGVELIDDIDSVTEDTLDVDFGVDADGVDDTIDMDIDGVDADVEAGIPGDLPPEPIDAIVDIAPLPTQSEAMSVIEDALNSIQSGLADIRLSEYKSLIQKLQDLTNQAQMMGRDYLGEQRRLKR